MPILFISTKSPLPLNDGHSIRTFHVLRLLAERHEVDLLSFVKFPEEHEHTLELKKYCRSVRLLDLPENNSKAALFKSLLASLSSSKPFVALKYDSAAMRRAIQEAISDGGIDLVHLDLAPLGCYLDLLDGVKAVLNAHNVESHLLLRRAENEANLFTRWFWAGQQRRYEAFERRVAGRVDHILCCSQTDRTMFSMLAMETPATVIPNGVDTRFFAPGDSAAVDPDRIVFVGGMNWFPNRDAVIWFDREIFPGILAERPNLTLHVIGRADGAMDLRHKARIVFHGFVEDIRPHMQRAAAMVVPLRIGGGTRLKVLNAMAMGTAVVSTSIGAEGLGASNGENVVLADDSAAFAAAVLKVAGDSALRKKLGVIARRFIVENYEWDRIGLRLHEVYEGLK
jgi:sugar transferase (PEP-CTERM/EpsH1 system associated)